ncbi:MAG: hypothetical protein IJ265_04870 [Oscillospiraceae bacterium]|nr:hypothetical protein [Oscillospiraceae bacterium]
MKNKKLLVGVITALLLCTVIGVAALMTSGKEKGSSEGNSFSSSDDMNITSNSYANEEEARIIQEAEKNGEIVYENSQVFEDDGIPGNGNTVVIND